jgi:hypothetical protein
MVAPQVQEHCTTPVFSALVTLATPIVPRRTFSLVVVASGHMIDRPDRTAPRFPAKAAPTVTQAVRRTLDDWGVGPGTLLVSGGASGADIIAAEQALLTGSEVWLLLALADDDFIAASVAIEGTDWEDRYRTLRRRCPSWVQEDELGPLDTSDEGAIFARNNEWCLEVGAAQAPPGGLRALAVWDGSAGDGRGGTADFVERAWRLGVEVRVISPTNA